jgi:hypothetical protein
MPYPRLIVNERLQAFDRAIGRSGQARPVGQCVVDIGQYKADMRRRVGGEFAKGLHAVASSDQML